MPEHTLEWFGHAGHFICSRDCRFHLTTLVNGKWVVSTVGELWPSRSVREIYAKVRDSDWLAEHRQLKGDEFDAAYMQRFGFEEIGCDRTYETMVFAAGARCAVKDCGCGLPSIDGSELDFDAYNDAKAATEGHRTLVAKWAEISSAPSAQERVL